MGRNITRKKHGVTELKNLNCFEVTKYIDNGEVLYELRYENYEIDSFDNYKDMINYVKKFDYSLFYQENWMEILDKRIEEFCAKTKEKTSVV